MADAADKLHNTEALKRRSRPDRTAEEGAFGIVEAKVRELFGISAEAV